MQNASTEKIYRVPLRRRLPWMIFIPAAVLFFVVFSLVISIPLLLTIDSVAKFGQVLLTLVPLCGITACTGLPVFVMLVPMALAFFRTSTLRVSPEGLDYDISPAIRHQCVWMDVSHIERLRGFDMLFLNQAKTTGNPFWVWYYKVAVPAKKHSVSLTVFDEWPNGELAADLRRFAPHLFEQASASI
jgi:hypothetical protein